MAKSSFQPRPKSGFLGRLQKLKGKDSDEAMSPSTVMRQYLRVGADRVTLLKSTLLLSLLTPAFDGLRSIPLLPSRLVGTELGDTIEPGRGTRVRTRFSTSFSSLHPLFLSSLAVD